MKKQILLKPLLLMMVTALALSASTAFAVYNENVPVNQGTSKPSNELPPQAKVPAPPATDLGALGIPGYAEDGYGDFVEGCRPWRGDVLIALFGPHPAPPVPGGPCCRGQPTGTTFNDEPTYFPNQCCNPPDFLDDYMPGPPLPALPGNHCLCFMMRGLQG